ncbi:MAG: hypothetical protein QOD45_1063 [Pseudonocardiales bacterium]|nr:hypothetical protein [Pseudonocardiales bacterium]
MPRQRWLGAVLIGALVAILGFGIAVQVHANSGGDNLSNLRESDLINILDDQNARADRLRQQIAALEQTLRSLQGSGDRSAAARAQAQVEAQALGILLGTLPATGPGVIVTIADPQRALTAEELLDVVAELRGAGAEAIDFGGVRVSTDSAFSTDGNQVKLDGAPLTPPYQVLAIGDPKTLDTALNIPGGVAATIRTEGGDLVVAERPAITIAAVRGLPKDTYATPAPATSSGH